MRLIELELIDRERRMVERRIRQARFPATKSLDTFEFTAIPGLNKMLVLELVRCEYVLRRENIIALGNSGTGKTHLATALAFAAVDVNSADPAQLDGIKGIGPAIAGKIAAERKKAPFKDWDDLIGRVSGIGEGIYGKIAPYITVR